MSKIKYEDISFTVKEGYPIIGTKTRYGYTKGWVVTVHGIVLVYAQGCKSDDDEWSTVEFFHEGRMYNRTFAGKRFSKIGLARMAYKFAREIVGAEI